MYNICYIGNYIFLKNLSQELEWDRPQNHSVPRLKRLNLGLLLDLDTIFGTDHGTDHGTDLFPKFRAMGQRDRENHIKSFTCART